MVRVEFLVRGMTCAACAARVENRLNAIANVSATVNFATEKATITGGGTGTKERAAPCLE
jgi:Cu+-exporting ATPase